MATAKIEFPPLLSEGLHPMSLADVKRICVSEFPLSKRREPIMTSLEALLAALSSAAVKAQVWIDGSFLTKKIDPDDVDLVVVLQEEDFLLAWANPTGKDVLERIVRKEFTNPVKCDSYISLEYPLETPRHALGQKQRDYWLKTFGESRSGDKKGMAVIEVPIT
jgi:hypothetical protein